MKLASSILALLCAAALAPAQSPDSSRVRFAISFARNSAPVSETLEAAADVYRKRLGKHAAEAKIISKPEKSQLSIELPFRSAFDALPARKLAKDVSEVATMLELDGDSVLPPGGLVSLGSEWLVFTKSEGATLAELKRGHWGTKAAAHPAGASLELFGLDRMGMLLQARGELVFLQAASEKYLQAKGTSSDEERKHLQSWITKHPDARLEEYDTLPREKGGPLPGTIWRRERWNAVIAQDAPREALLLLPADSHCRFTQADIAEYGQTPDEIGYPAISFELRKERVAEFSAWTESIVGSSLAIVFDDELLVLATVRGKLPGAGVIEGGSGGFREGELSALLELLRLPMLPSRPASVSTEFLP